VRRAVAALCVLGVATSCSGCSCDDLGVGSVAVTVVDASGAVVTDAKVVYSVDGTPFQDAICTTEVSKSSTGNATASGGGAGGCLEWDAGTDWTGTYEVLATSGGRQGHGEVHVGKDIGACHVNPQTLTVKVE